MQRVIKRIFDFVFACICSIFAAPMCLVTMLVIKINSPESPVVFNQTRIGYKGKEYTLHKLRSMTNETDNEGNLLPDEYRLKTWGKIIRKCSLDELPQVFQIVAGRMSWIGPRPLLPKEMLVMTEEEQIERQSMLPGITGWEAVNEDKSDSRREMAEYDLYYVRNWSIGLDVKIFWKTVMKLFTANRSDDEHRAPKLDEKEFHSSRVIEDKENAHE